MAFGWVKSGRRCRSAICGHSDVVAEVGPQYTLPEPVFDTITVNHPIFD